MTVVDIEVFESEPAQVAELEAEPKADLEAEQVAGLKPDVTICWDTTPPSERAGEKQSLVSTTFKQVSMK